MQWRVLKMESAGNKSQFSRYEIISMLSTGQLSLNDEIKRPMQDSPWLHIYEVPEITTPQDSYFRAVEAFEEKCLDTAKKAFYCSITDPRYIRQSCLYLGIINSSSEEWEKAAAWLRLCPDIPYFYPLVLNNLAVCNAYLNNIAEAEKLLAQISFRTPFRRRIWNFVRYRAEKNTEQGIIDRKLKRIVRMNQATLLNIKSDGQVKAPPKSDFLLLQGNPIQVAKLLFENLKPQKIPLDYEAILPMKKRLINYALILDPDLYARQKITKPPEEARSTNAQITSRYNLAMELFEGNMIEESLRTLIELYGHRDGALPDLPGMIIRCDERIVSRLVDSFRELKTTDRFELALGQLSVIEKRIEEIADRNKRLEWEDYPEKDLLQGINTDFEKSNIEQSIISRNAEKALDNLSSEVESVEQRYRVVSPRFNPAIDAGEALHALIRLKDQAQEILSRSNPLAASSSHRFAALLHQCGVVHKNSGHDIKGIITRDLDNYFASHPFPDYLKRVVHYEKNCRHICKELDIPIDQHINKVNSQARMDWNALNKRIADGLVGKDGLLEYSENLNTIFSLISAGEELVQIQEEFLDKMFSDGIIHMIPRNSVEALLSYAPDKLREKHRLRYGFYLIEQEFKKLRSSYIDRKTAPKPTSQPYKNTEGPLDEWRSRIQSLCSYADRSEEYKRKIIDIVTDLSSLFRHHSDHEAEMMTLGVLINRLGVDDEKTKRQLETCRQARAFPSKAGLKRELQRIYDSYYNIVDEAEQGVASANEMYERLSSFSRDEAYFLSNRDSVKGVEGTNPDQWLMEIRRFRGILARHYETQLKNTIQQNLARNQASAEAVRAAIKYIERRPYDYIKAPELQELLQLLLETDSAALSNDQKQFLESTGISSLEILSAAISIYQVENKDEQRNLIVTLKNENPPAKLAHALDYHLNILNMQEHEEKCKRLQKEFWEALPAGFSSSSVRYEEVIDRTIKWVNADSFYKSNQAFLNDHCHLELKRRKEHLIRHATVWALQPSNLGNLNSLLNELPDAISRPVGQNGDILDALFLNRWEKAITSPEVEACSFNEEDWNNLLRGLAALKTRNPSKALSLSSALKEKIASDSNMSDEEKQRHSALLEKQSHWEDDKEPPYKNEGDIE